MLGRGMRLPTTITSDGAPGLINAITACFPSSVRIRCWFHYADLGIMLTWRREPLVAAV